MIRRQRTSTHTSDSDAALQKQFVARLEMEFHPHAKALATDIAKELREKRMMTFKGLETLERNQMGPTGLQYSECVFDAIDDILPQAPKVCRACLTERTSEAQPKARKNALEPQAQGRSGRQLGRGDVARSIYATVKCIIKQGKLDTAMWGSCVDKALSEVAKTMTIQDIHKHYAKCNKDEQDAICQQVQVKAQGIYNYRAGKKIYRANRKKVPLMQ